MVTAGAIVTVTVLLTRESMGKLIRGEIKAKEAKNVEEDETEEDKENREDGGNQQQPQAQAKKPVWQKQKKGGKKSGGPKNKQQQQKKSPAIGKSNPPKSPNPVANHEAGDSKKDDDEDSDDSQASEGTASDSGSNSDRDHGEKVKFILSFACACVLSKSCVHCCLCL